MTHRNNHTISVEYPPGSGHRWTLPQQMWGLCEALIVNGHDIAMSHDVGFMWHARVDSLRTDRRGFSYGYPGDRTPARALARAVEKMEATNATT